MVRIQDVLRGVLPATLVVLSVWAAVADPARGGWVATHDLEAMEFELQDQFGKALAYRFPKDKISVLTFGDRKGSAQIEGWVRPLFDRYQQRIDLHGRGCAHFHSITLSRLHARAI